MLGVHTYWGDQPRGPRLGEQFSRTANVPALATAFLGPEHLGTPRTGGSTPGGWEARVERAENAHHRERF